MSKNDLMRKPLCGVSAYAYRLCGYYLYNRITHKAQRGLVMRQQRFRIKGNARVRMTARAGGRGITRKSDGPTVAQGSRQRLRNSERSSGLVP
jgi:hypothetical protein